MPMASSGNGPGAPTSLTRATGRCRGALGEYNGKFMSNQFVLRGSSVATPEGHARPDLPQLFLPPQRGSSPGCASPNRSPEPHRPPTKTFHSAHRRSHDRQSEFPRRRTADPVFLDDVRSGLGAGRKMLSPKYFYDAAGSELFEAITALPEYYPTRTEIGILDGRGGRDRGCCRRGRRGGVRQRARRPSSGACCGTCRIWRPTCRSTYPGSSWPSRPPR